MRSPLHSWNRKAAPAAAPGSSRTSAACATASCTCASSQKPQPNDATLVAKVESEVFRDTEVPSGSVNVNAENGVVVLRGQLESEQLIDQLVAKVRKVQGVQDVESLLHLPGAEAPMHGAHAS